MTNQKTPVQGGATEEQIEAAARALACLEPGEDWPTNGELGGSPTGTRDDEYRDGMRDTARDALEAAAAVSASVSAPLADERHGAEERERVCGHWWDVPASPYYESAGLFKCALPLAHGGPHVDAKDGVRWHGDPSSVGTCGAPSEREAESEDHAATVTGDREKMIAVREELARTLFIASDDFAFADRMAKAWDAPGPHGRQRWYNYADAVLRKFPALAAPVEVDAGQLSVVIHRAHQEWPEYSESRVNLGYAEYLAIVVTEWLRGEDQ